jgi:hypothetical protein
MGPEWRSQFGEILYRGSWAGRLILGVKCPTLPWLHGGDWDKVFLDLLAGICFGQFRLGRGRVCVRSVFGDVREAVVQILGRVAHVQCCWIHEPLGHEPRIGISAGAHGVVAHVLHAAGNDDVVRAEADATRRRRHCCHGSGAHAVDCEARHRAGKACQKGGRPANGEALIARLGGRGDGYLVNAVSRQRRIAAHQFPDAFHDKVISARTRINAFLAGFTEGCPHTIHEHDVADAPLSTA